MIEMGDLLSRAVGSLVIQGPVVDWLLGLLGDSVVGLSLIPKVIFLHTDAPQWALWHEQVHQAQMTQLGPFYWPVYLYQLLRFGYISMPLEIEAHQF